MDWKTPGPVFSTVSPRSHDPGGPPNWGPWWPGVVGVAATCWPVALLAVWDVPTRGEPPAVVVGTALELVAVDGAVDVVVACAGAD